MCLLGELQGKTAYLHTPEMGRDNSLELNLLCAGKTNDDSAFRWQRNEVDGKTLSYYSAWVVEIYETLVLLLPPVMSFQNLAIRILRENAAIL